MKVLLQLLFLLFVSVMMVTCEQETYPHIRVTQTESIFDPELHFGSVNSQKTFGISNRGSGTLSWSISENLNWLVTDKTEGNSIDDTTIVTVTVNRDGLEAGVYKGNIEITGGIVDVILKVTMVVAITGTFTDSRDNHEYNWVQIGDQIWMSENLAWLPKVFPPSEGSFTEPYYYVHSYEGTNVAEAKAMENYKIHGVLYNLPAALVACPDGWHLPSNDDWDKLVKYVNNGFGPYTREAFRWTDNEGEHLSDSYKGAGKHLATFYNGTNDFGFSGVPSSYRHNKYDFGHLGSSGYWWSTTEFFHKNKTWGARLAILPYSSKVSFIMYDTYEDYGISIRCIKD